MKTLTSRVQWWVGIVLALGGLFLYLNLLPAKWKEWQRPSKAQIWRYAEAEAKKEGLDPDFVYAIIFAESSFNPDADTGYARGLMQVSENAWDTVERKSWKYAYDWKLNIRVGTAYLAWLKKQLEKEGKFSYPLLAASYRYGLGRVKAVNYEIGRLPVSGNHTYQKLFAGNVKPVARPL